MSFWSEIEATIRNLNVSDTKLDIIIDDIKNEFKRQYPDAAKVREAINWTDYDYPTIVLRMDRSSALTNNVIMWTKLDPKAIPNKLAEDHKKSGELVSVIFTDKPCEKCGYLCVDACNGLYLYYGYWVHFQFPHLKY